MTLSTSTMLSIAQLDELKQLVAQKTGLRVPPDAHDRFVDLLHERADHLGYATLESYQTYLSGNEAEEEWEAFARIFTSSETFFFRDHGQFDLLRLRLLPELIERHRNDKTLRLWSAGCSSGEEAYSLSMLVDMLLPERGGWNILILGTDIDSRAIAKARHGHYGKWSFRMVPAALQQRYFHLEDNEWILDERIRRMVTFRVANLVDEAFPDPGTELHDMDIILCRNMFIYFAPVAVSAVAAKFVSTLVEGGYLMTAHTELIGLALPGLESRLFAEGVVHQRHVHPPASLVQSPVAASTVRVVPRMPVRGVQVQDKPVPVLPQGEPPAIVLSASAQAHADRGEYERAEQICHQSLAADPLAVAPYFLLAQLAQFRGNLDQAKEYLNKVIYLDHRCVAAYLELAALHERAGNMPQAHALRHAALGIVRAMPDDEPIKQYERTAGELAQWLAQWEQPANNHGNAGRRP